MLCVAGGCVFDVSLLEVALEELGVDEPLLLWLDGAAQLELELDGVDDCEVEAPPEAEPDFFSVSVLGGVVVAEELDEPEGVLGVVADEELVEPDGGVALPPTDAEPEAEPDGALGVVDEDEDAVSRGADGVAVELEDELRWSGPRSQAARPRAMATAIAIVEILMRPPWLGTRESVAGCVPGPKPKSRSLHICEALRPGL